MKKIILSALFLLCLTSFIFAQQSLNKTFEGVKEIQINIGAGDLIIDKANNNSVALSVEYNANQLEPQIKLNNGKLVLDEKKLNRKNTDKSSWKLHIPDELIVTSNVGAGETAYSGVYIKLDHNSGAGTISFTQVSGRIKANNGVGNISVSQSEGDFNLNSGTGNLNLDQAKGSFSLNSGTGSVNVTNSSVTGKSNLNSGTGNVLFEMSQKIEADISLNSGTGNSTLDFNGQTIAGYFEMQCSEKQGSISAPFNFDSTEKIDRGGKNNTVLKKSAKIGSGQPNIMVSTGTGTASVKQ